MVRFGIYGWQYEILKCPFCEKGEISCKWYPGAVSQKRSKTASLPGKGSFHKSKEVWIVESGCNICNKSKEEVEKEFKKRGVI